MIKRHCLYCVLRTFVGGFNLHIDELPVIAKINFPICNTEHTYNEWYTVPEEIMSTIEPMINVGKPDVKILQDNWTAVTRDRSLSAQFEHMIGVTETGYEILRCHQRDYTNLIVQPSDCQCRQLF